MVAQRENTTLRYVHQDSLSSTSVMTTSGGSLDSSMTTYPFGITRTGDVNSERKFTGQRLDDTGLYYYGARYYDASIGRFISPDTATPDLMNPQSFNKYSYCFNNPLKYNDPTGHWPKWAKIGQSIVSGAKAVVNQVKAGFQAANAKAEQLEQDIKTKANEVRQAVLKKVKQSTENVIENTKDAVGIESISSMNPSLVQDVPVIDVRQGSLLDKALFFTNGAVTLYPFGVFTNDPMSTKVEEHEGYHWQEQSKSGPFVVGWYTQYICEYGQNWVGYLGNGDYAHDAVSFERRANDYAGTGTTPPNVWDYWWDQIFP